MALKSELFTSDRDVKNRLELCQDYDRHHVLLGDKGKYVSFIQEALRRVMPELRLPAEELTNPVLARYGIYGPQTAAAVARYKRGHKPQILNYRSQIDPVVGRQTITALDKDIYKLDNPGRTKPGKFRPF